MAKQPELSSAIEQIVKQHGSAARTASKFGLPADRLKRSIRLNTFSEADLAVLMPGTSLEELHRQYEFKTLRRYRGSSGFTSEGVFNLFDLLVPSFQLLQIGRAHV